MSRVLLAHADALRRLAEGVAFLSPPELKRWRGFTRPERREQYRLGRWLLRRACVDAVGGRPEDWAIAAEGPPLARHARGWKAPWLSLSHSGPYYAAAVSFRGPVGIDLEQKDQQRPWRHLAQHQGWDLGPGPAREAFLRRWCDFEAGYKAPHAHQRASIEHAGFLAALASHEGGLPSTLWLGLRP